MILGTDIKDAVLRELAELIDTHRSKIISANQQDLAAARDLDPTLIDRLLVDDKKVDGMIAAIEEVIALDDPQGKVLSDWAENTAC